MTQHQYKTATCSWYHLRMKWQLTPWPELNSATGAFSMTCLGLDDQQATRLLSNHVLVCQGQGSGRLIWPAVRSYSCMPLPLRPGVLELVEVKLLGGFVHIFHFWIPLASQFLIVGLKHTVSYFSNLFGLHRLTHLCWNGFKPPVDVP